MLRQNCSFLFVEAPELRDLFQRAYPNLTLRRRDYFKRTVILSMAEEIRRKITQRIGNDKYALTSDGWSQVTKSPALFRFILNKFSMCLPYAFQFSFSKEQNFSNRVAPFVQILIRSLNDRLPELSNNTILRIAMLLDPRFAYSDLFPGETWKSIEQQFIEFAKEELLVINSVANLEPVSFDLEEEILSEEAESSDHLSTSSDEKYDIWAKPKSPCTSTLPNTTISGEESADFVSKIESQLSQYKAWQRVPVDSDLFSWWRDNGKFIPEMAKIAQMLHCIPATSICSERLFSKAGLIYANTLRNRLSGKTVRQILVVKANLDKVLLAPSNNDESDSESEDNED
uniref:HAT C-terminal dimerisation domain-containing protein n=1 Tax=Meloidogyne incognita TaxID=6306 RepID=A0A914M0F5_MELIC